MIDSLEIYNWKTHRKTSLNFQKGVNVLIGVMGAGKSSAIDAISFGLFGTFPALNSKRVTLSELITNRPSQESEAEVKLGFTIDGNEYKVTRKIGGSGNSAKLEKNGAHLQSQATKVTEEIESVLKLDYDTFSRVVYAEQNRLDYFLELPKSERKKQIDHMLGLDIFATAEENATTLINRIKDTVNTEEEMLARTDIVSLRKQMKQLEAEKDSLEEEREKMRKEEKRKREELSETKAKLDVLKKKMAEKKGLSDELVKLQARINTLREEIKKIETLKIDEKRAREVVAKLENEERELAKETEEIRRREKLRAKALSDVEANAKINQKRLAERDKIMEELGDRDESGAKRELDAAASELEQLNSEIAAKRGKASELREWIKELNKHISKCPVCERDLPEELKATLLNQKSSAADSIEDEIKKIEKVSDAKSAHIKKLTDLHTKIMLASSRLSEFKNLDKDIESNRRAEMEAHKELEDLQKELEKKIKEEKEARDALGAARLEAQTAERKQSYELEVKKTSEQLDKRKREFNEIDVDEKIMYEIQENITKQSSVLSDVTSKIQGNDKYISGLEPQIKEKGKQIAEFEKIEKLIAKRQGQVSNLNKFKMALIDTEAILRNRLVSSINSLMQSLWPRLYPYGDYTSIRLSAKKDDYLLEVNTARDGSESWIQVDGIASGGERSVGCLAMRIALAMVIVPNLKWLILDEPTHNIDSTGITKLIDVLGEELPNVVDQIFIITHDENLRQISSAKVYQFERDKEASSPTSISEI